MARSSKQNNAKPRLYNFFTRKPHFFKGLAGVILISPMTSLLGIRGDDHNVLVSDMFENLNEKLERSFKLLKGQGKITEINVREEAMLAALKESKKDDVLAFLGKGHERTIEYATGPKPWNERAAAEAAIGLIAKN